MKKILFTGDSITDEGRSRENNSYLGRGYAVMTAGRLSAEYPGEFEYINRGISGNRSVDLYARIKEDAINLKPDYMSILIGINDVWHEIASNCGVSAEKYKKILGMYISEIKEALPDVKIIILEPFVLCGTATEAHFNEFKEGTDKVRKIAESIAEQFGLKYVKLQDKISNLAEKIGNENVLVDGVHPNIAGDALMAVELAEAFKEIM